MQDNSIEKPKSVMMKADLALDSVELRISKSRTRCEIYIKTEGVSEKFASGFLKPFVANLQAAQAQISKGLQTVLLERPLSSTEHGDGTWFTKGTLERFVRFVSTPEVLERVKTLDEELNQLEQVRKFEERSLAKIKDQNGHNGAIFSTSGSRTTKETPMRKVPFETIETRTEASKRELLKAMEVRIEAMHQEQDVAFAHAAATGFDADSIAELMAFAEYFGACHLREACAEFLELYKKRKNNNNNIECATVTQPESSCSEISIGSNGGADNDCAREISSWETSSSGISRGILKSETNRNMGSILGNHNMMEFGYRDKDSSRKSKSSGTDLSSLPSCKIHSIKLSSSHRRASSVDTKWIPTDSSENKSKQETVQETLSHEYHPGELNLKDGMFLSNLKKMAKKVEARRPEHSIASMFDEDEEKAWGELSRHPSLGRESKNLSEKSVMEVSSGARKDFVPPSSDVENKIYISNQGSIAISNNDLAYHQDFPSNNQLESSKEVEVSNEKSVEGSSVRKLSVQAAISLFESKRKYTGEGPVKMIPGRQDIGKKFMLRRGSSGGYELNFYKYGNREDEKHMKSEITTYSESGQSKTIGSKYESGQSQTIEPNTESKAQRKIGTYVKQDVTETACSENPPDRSSESRVKKLTNQPLKQFAKHIEQGKNKVFDSQATMGPVYHELEVNSCKFNDYTDADKVEFSEIQSVKIANFIEQEKDNASKSPIKADTHILQEENVTYSEMEANQTSENKNTKLNSHTEEAAKTNGIIRKNTTEISSAWSGAKSDKKTSQQPSGNQKIRIDRDMHQYLVNSNMPKSERAASFPFGLAKSPRESTSNYSSSVENQSTVSMQNADRRKEFKLKLEQTLFRDSKTIIDKKVEYSGIKLEKHDSIDSNLGKSSLMRESFERLSTVASQVGLVDELNKTNKQSSVAESPSFPWWGLKGIPPPPMPPPKFIKTLPKINNGKVAEQGMPVLKDPMKAKILPRNMISTVDMSREQVPMQDLEDTVRHRKLGREEDDEAFGGRFYKQYSQLRDVRLRMEEAARREERESKIRDMAENLVKSKSEMQARSVRSLRRPIPSPVSSRQICASIADPKGSVAEVSFLRVDDSDRGESECEDWVDEPRISPYNRKQIATVSLDSHGENMANYRHKDTSFSIVASSSLTSSLHQNDLVTVSHPMVEASLLRVDESEQGSGSEGEDWEDKSNISPCNQQHIASALSGIHDKSKPEYWHKDASFSVVASSLMSSLNQVDSIAISPLMSVLPPPPNSILKPAFFPAYANPPSITFDSSSLKSPTSQNLMRARIAPKVDAPHPRKIWGMHAIPSSQSRQDDLSKDMIEDLTKI